jgi:hypothetical protein
MLPDSYSTFFNMFLAEMPMRVNGRNDFEFQHQALLENINDGYEVTPISSSVFRLDAGYQSTYWVGSSDAEQVLLIVDVEASSTFCKVVLTSKDPTLGRNTPPYASDLYALILADAKVQNLVLSSDSMMSDNALDLWKRLHSSGHTLSVYDRSTYEYVLQPVTDPAELDKFMGGVEHNKYVFVMAENASAMQGLKHAVKLMEIKRNSGYPLIEMFTTFRKR